MLEVALDSVGFEERLHALKSLTIDDRFVLAFEPFASMVRRCVDALAFYQP